MEFSEKVILPHAALVQVDCLKFECLQVLGVAHILLSCVLFESRKKKKKSFSVQWYSDISNWFVSVMGGAEPNVAISCLAFGGSSFLVETCVGS